MFRWMFAWLVLVISVNYVYSIQELRVVSLDEGKVQGEKYWNGDYFQFYGIPYASVPKGKDRFQAPLPPKPWDGVLEANDESTLCPQPLVSDDEDGVVGQEECLVMNLFVPTKASENNLKPVIVYIHSGGFALGHGSMAKYHYIARHDVIVVNFNFRLGAVGFACLGTKDIPGNAGLKDQVAALKWINKNIKKFGGDPKKVSLAGFSVGAAMAELLYISPATDGLINTLILDSGSALAHWAVNYDPIDTATNIAQAIGYNGTGNIEDLTKFYMTKSLKAIASKSMNFFLKNGTFGYAPCIENVHTGVEAFMTKTPMELINKKDPKYRVPILTGFANMEGISRINHFSEWSDDMEENFSEYLPTNLIFPNDESKKVTAKQIKDFYFHGEDITLDTLREYVDYSSDFMFKYSIMKSAKLHAKLSDKPVYLYEFSHVGKLTTRHNYMHLITGASHRDQTGTMLQFSAVTTNSKDLDARDRMTSMWTDFAVFGDPTAYESVIVDYKWPAYDDKNKYYLHINTTVEIKQDLFEESYKFWDKIYDKYYKDPESPEVTDSK